jgi:hypothetical protein
LKKDKLAVLEKGQYTLTFLFFVVGIALFQAAFHAITPGFSLIVLDAVLLIDGQVAVGVGDGVTARIAFNLAQ